jgi:hypothetical protein
MGRESLKDIIARAAQILGVEANTLTETEAREALRDNVMRTENRRMHKARDDITKKRTS